MTFDTKDMLGSILETIQELDYINPDDVPHIPLYMDQVTTFMDAQLATSKRYSDDKILTKTMINNYAKNNLLPPPDKKKYSKEHLLLLIFIYYFKNFLSISDTQSLLNPLTDKHFNTSSEINLSDIYQEIFDMETGQIEAIMKDVTRKYETAQKTFPDAKKKDADYLHLYAFICLLSFEVYTKKQLVEKLIDALPDHPNKKKKESKKKETD